MKIHKSPEYVKFLNKQIINKNGLVGSELYSNRCGKFKVLEKTNEKTNDRHKIYKIIFIKTKSIYYVTKNKMLSGEIKDYMYPSISGIGFLGKEYLYIKQSDPELCEILRIRWKSIIERVYNKNNNNYANYGRKGVHVDSEWHNFSIFYNDITHMKEFNRDDFIKGYIDIDKDLKQSGLPISKKIYSKNTVSLIDHKTNMKYIDYEKLAEKQSKYFIIENKNGEQYLCKNISKFAKSINVKKQNICKILNNKLVNNTIGGYKYRYPSKYEIEMIKSKKIKIGDKLN